MKRMLWLLLCPTVVVAQQLVRIDAPGLYDKLPPIPATVKEAFALCTMTTSESSYSVSADKTYKPMEAQLAGLQEQFKAAIVAMDAPAVEAMKKEQQKDMAKKMKAMSQAEKIAYAMELSKSTGMNQTMVQESPAVTEALKACSDYTQTLTADVQATTQSYQKRAQEAEATEKQHAAIDAWQEAEAKKLPQVSGGEMSWPEPKALRALRLKATDKHIAVANEYLAKLRKAWIASRDARKKDVTPFQQKLAAVHFGDDVRNVQFKRQLLNGEAQMCSPVTTLLAESRQATEQAAHYEALRLQIEQQKP